MFIFILLFLNFLAALFLVLWPWIEPRPLAMRVSSSNHCTTREFPRWKFIEDFIILKPSYVTSFPYLFILGLKKYKSKWEQKSEVFLWKYSYNTKLQFASIRWHLHQQLNLQVGLKISIILVLTETRKD